jgi:succinyl-diaminopimelate desuccinylase
MARVIDAFYRALWPKLEGRITEMPVVPEMARRPTINVNAIRGGQPMEAVQTPCVADRCQAVFDRRFLIEEGFERTREEIGAILEQLSATIPDMWYELKDLMVVHPVQTPEDSPLIETLDHAIEEILGRPATLVASPGTYDHKHVARIGGVKDCVAYGPGILDLAHQPNEWCGVDDLIASTKVMALSLMHLAG